MGEIWVGLTSFEMSWDSAQYGGRRRAQLGPRYAASWFEEGIWMLVDLGRKRRKEEEGKRESSEALFVQEEEVS